MRDHDLAADLEARGAHGGAYHGATYRCNAQGPKNSALLQPRTNGMHKLDSRFNVYHDPMDALGGHAGRVHASVANDVRAHEARETAARQRITVDKSDRATVEQALDPRTRMVLFKVSVGYGCISATGKVACVWVCPGR